ncbi:hypothetical protein JOE61_000352 [Nocardioides salarius]|uniref:Uncharacterized protein n=1 Tax=Nocardioides salarius TaxID=374513 RepID=A0ABS2M5T5_9ACTN|nr:hypothetical protein [Nocardioides salarius]MBM7506538.1 hypothetical protein [Nocardioides salarius]
MSTLINHGTDHRVVRSVTRIVGSVGVTLPASPKVRASVVDDYKRAMGLDLSDDDRAAKVRRRRR